MNEPSCRRGRADWRAVWVYLIGAGLSLFGWQAGAVDPSAQQDARSEAIDLLRRSQNESGRRSIYLPRAYERIQLGLAASKDDPLQQGQWLEALWEYHLLNDDHARARQALESAMEFLTAAHADASHIDRVACNLSYSLILLGEVAQAKDLLRRAIVSATQQNNRALLAELYYALGDAYRKTGERLVAQRYFEAAYELDQASGDSLKISISKMKLGSLARDRGEYQEAVDRHEQALQVFIDERNYRELVSYIELARDYAAQGESSLAQSYAQLALDDPRALPEQRIDASVLLLKFANDRRHTAQAAKLIRDIEILINRSSARQKSELARPTHQLQFAEQAIRYYASNRDLTNVQARGQAAIRLARRVANDLRDTHDDSLAWLTAAQPVINEYVKALYELDRSQVLPLLETYYAQQIAPAELRHSGVVGRAYEAEAVELFEQYRVARQVLMDATAAVDRLHPDTTDATRRREAKTRLDQALREWDRARDAYLTMYRAPAASTTTARDSPARRPTSAPGKDVTGRQPTLVPDKDVAAFRPSSLPRTDVFIRYFVQENVSFGIALAGNEIRYFDLPPRSTVQTLVQRSLDGLSSPGQGAQAEATLSSLAQLLPLDFIRTHGAATRLVIVPDDVMQPLPFSAIDLDEQPHAYAPLITKFEVVRARSLSGYYAQRSAAANVTSNGTDIVVFADPVLSTQSLQRVQPRTGLGAEIPNSRAEADSIARIFAPRVITYAGANATGEVLLSPEVRAAKVLHIATHGYFSKTTPDIVGLVTSSRRDDGKPDGAFLGFTELFSAPLSSKLVIISGCETMRGKDYTGWGVRSLADGFLSQGAGSVIGTLWSVSDAATAALMASFYRGLQRGASSSAALQAAQRELFASRRFTDPYYWAGVALASSNRGFDQLSL